MREPVADEDAKLAVLTTNLPVAWNSSAVSYPTMGEESTKPELLLKVKAL